MKQSFTYLCAGILLATGAILSTVAAQSTTTNTTGTNTVTSASGEQLCILSNGNKIPCEFAPAAEIDIADGDAITVPATGQKFCKSELDIFLTCDTLNADGTIKSEFWMQKLQIQASKIWMQVTAGQYNAIIGTLALLLVILTVLMKVFKKKKVPTVTQ